MISPFFRFLVFTGSTSATLISVFFGTLICTIGKSTVPKEEEANANLKKIQETGYFSDLQVYMKEDNKAYKPDERDSFQS